MNEITLKDSTLAPAITVQPAVIGVDMEAARAKVMELVGDYMDVTPEVAVSMVSRDYKDAKARRADLNKVSRELNDARKAVKKAAEEPIKAFEEQVKELDAIIKAPADAIDAAIKEHEAREQHERYLRLEEAYNDLAPALAMVVPFEKVAQGEKWLNRSVSEKKAEEQMCAKARDLASQYDTLKASALNYRDEACEQFFRTLSLQDALNYDARLKEERDRIAAMEKEREAYRAAQEAATAGQDVEAESQEAPGAPEVPEPRDLPRFEEVRVYALAVEMTEAQFNYVVGMLKAQGVHGLPMRLPCGSWKDAAERIKGAFAYA